MKPIAAISFRTRLFLIAALIVAAVLAAVMTLGWYRVLAIELDRLDDRLCQEGRRLVLQPPRGDRLALVEADIADKLRLTASAQLMLRAGGADNARNRQASPWSADINAEGLDWKPAGRQPDPAPLAAPPPRGERPLRAEEEDGPPPGPGRFPPGERPPRGVCSLASFQDHDRAWRAARFELVDAARPGSRSFIAADLAATKADLQTAMVRALGIVVPLGLALSAAGAWLLASLMMRPVNRLREAMKSVTTRALDQRLPAGGEDREFAELISAYNTMLARLDASFRQASRFSADAAHELKTPLTILQGQIEQAIAHSDRRAVQADLTGMLDEVGRLAAITRKLLLLSQADAGRLALNRKAIDLSELLEGLLADAQMLLDGQTLSTAIDRGLVIDADEILLRQLLNNLLSNAVRYCPPGGWIKVNAQMQLDGIELRFANRSRPIPRADRERFFDRFFRGDAAHSRQVEGNGLGLSLAREIARAHGGELKLLDSAAEEVILQLWLPRRARS